MPTRSHGRCSGGVLLNNLLLLLLFVFAGVALMVVLGGRFSKPIEPQRLNRITRWIYPLVGLMLLLSVAGYYWPG